jgi:hypothetical protein
MRSQGLPNFPDPDSSGGIPKQAVISALQAVSSSQAQAAQNACNHLMPSGGLSGQPSQPITDQDEHYYLNAAVCMRTHGFPNFPDPVFSDGGVSFSIPSSIDKSSPRYSQAAQTCKKLIPAGLPQSNNGSGG